MSKPTKTKKSKVPKITEAEYAAYLSSLTTGGNSAVNADVGSPSKQNQTKKG